MTKARLPYFQLFTRDWLASESINMMTPEQEGWYMHLLCHAWNSDPVGTLPNDDLVLQRLARAGHNWDADKALVLQNFSVKKFGDTHRLVNARLFEQNRERDAFHRLQRDKAKKGADARWHKPGNAQALPGDALSTATATAKNNGSGGSAQTHLSSHTGKPSASATAQRGTPSPATPGTGASRVENGNGQVFVKGEAELRQCVLFWAKNVSDWWYKEPGREVTDNNFSKARSQFHRYLSKLSYEKKSAFVELVRSQPPEEDKFERAAARRKEMFPEDMD